MNLSSNYNKVYHLKFFLWIGLSIICLYGVASAQDIQRLTIKPQKLEIYHSYEGYIEPFERVIVRSETSGTIEKTTFEEGKVVKKNQILVNVSTERLALQEQLANSNYKLAEYEYLAQKQLFDQNVSSASSLNSYINKRDVGKIQLELAKLDLEKSKVKSPITGVVKSKLIQTGETVNANQNLLEVMNVSKVLAKINIPGNDMFFVFPGKTMRVRISALPGLVFDGKVHTLGQEADKQTQQFPAEIIIENPRGQLFPGMDVYVESRTIHMENQILIPRAAVMDLNKSPNVYVLKNNKASKRQLKLGTIMIDSVQVMSGLKFGELIIISGLDSIREGMIVGN
ncbi:MAG: efflux RND transporter periplasmic adaptor subunit [Deltaproteobacteria bacterium]|nr:efflux RND transporter periplasmic adaptor subunit [Deltaproteobacteria bacterium]MBT4527207.1 efflux RND transporter periplasmic adaptor subunit [Deltaproteobacteria bacterium]